VNISCLISAVRRTKEVMLCCLILATFWSQTRNEIWATLGYFLRMVGAKTSKI